MAKIRIEIEDKNFDIGTFVSTFASNSRVTVNIFTSEDEINKVMVCPLKKNRLLLKIHYHN